MEPSVVYRILAPLVEVASAITPAFRVKVGVATTAVGIVYTPEVTLLSVDPERYASAFIVVDAETVRGPV